MSLNKQYKTPTFVRGMQGQLYIYQLVLVLGLNPSGCARVRVRVPGLYKLSSNCTVRLRWTRMPFSHGHLLTNLKTTPTVIYYRLLSYNRVVYVNTRYRGISSKNTLNKPKSPLLDCYLVPHPHKIREVKLRLPRVVNYPARTGDNNA